MAVRVPKRSNTDLLSVLALWALDMIDDRIGKEVRDERRETEFTIDLVTSTAFVDCEHSWPQLVYTLVSCIREKFSYRGLATPKTERRYMPYKHSVILVPICNCVQSYTQVINIFIIFSNKRQTEIIQWISSRVKLVINELTDYFPRNHFSSQIWFSHFSNSSILVSLSIKISTNEKFWKKNRCFNFAKFN